MYMLKINYGSSVWPSGTNNLAFANICVNVKVHFDGLHIVLNIYVSVLAPYYQLTVIHLIFATK